MKNLWKAASFSKAVLKRDLRFHFEMIPLSIHRPSVRQLSCLVRTETDRVFPKGRVRGLPSVLQVEPTNVCNLRCPLCPSGRHSLSRSTGFMRRSVYERLMEEIGPGLSLLILWGWGEPLLHPELTDMIGIAKSYNTAVVTSTNGQCLDEKTADALVTSGLDAIVVALDGATQETYSSYRVGGRLERVIETLNLLRQAKECTCSSHPLVNLRTVVTRQNEQEIPEIRRLAIEHGVGMLTLRGLAMTDLWDDELEQQYMPVDASHSMYRYRNGQRVRGKIYTCRRPWKRATVAWDGAVLSCEMDYACSTVFGRFPDDGGLADIWNNALALRFRESFLRDRVQFEFCARCPFNDRVTEDCTLERVEVSA